MGSFNFKPSGSKPQITFWNLKIGIYFLLQILFKVQQQIVPWPSFRQIIQNSNHSLLSIREKVIKHKKRVQAVEVALFLS